MLETEWKKKSVLPFPRTSPPPSSAQKVHKTVEYVSPESRASPTPAAESSMNTPAATASPESAHNAAPAAHGTPASEATTNMSNYSYGKPVAIRPRSAQLSPEMDVDIMSEPGGREDDGDGGIDRDEESEEIVRQLEKGLPRWPGFGEEGWRDDVSQVRWRLQWLRPVFMFVFSKERISEIIHAIKSYKDLA